MDQNQKQALANYFRSMGGGEFALDSALTFAAALSPGGKLSTEDFWREILRDEEQELPSPPARIKS